MPIKLFGNSSSSYDNGNKIDTSLFIQKLYLRTNYTAINCEEDTELKNQNTIKIYQTLYPYEEQLEKIMLIIYLTILVF